MKTLTQNMDYNPKTGVFTWIKANGRKIRAGGVAGCIDSINGYIVIKMDGRSYKAHRLAWLYMTGEWPKDQIDHINHDRADNRWENLREATNHENRKNQSMQKRNKSGVTGVRFRRTEKYWEARITVNKKAIHLHYSKDKFEAVCARKSAEVKYGYHENHGK